MSSPRMETPRPKPLFFQPPLTFSTKKERGRTPKDSAPPPRCPIKSAPPISRIFPRKQLVKALPVTFKSPDKPVLSDRIYNEGKKELYFDQCFDIESKLGVGSFGEVFKVKSKEDGKFYAVKRSRQRFRGESDRHRRFEEVVKHETLPVHPNCVTFVKAWEEKQYLYIQTELCKMSLNMFAEDNHDIPERLIWNYLVDLLMAVKHLHDHDLVHMDIKPENIFISSNNICKLGDFGLVIDLHKDVEISEAQEGDPKYLAPELMMSRFGKPADVFSVGITILELASDLDLPRGGDLWHKLRSGQLPEEFLIGISSELKTIIRWMMQPDPALRPTVNDVLAHEFVVKIWHERKSDQFDVNHCSTSKSEYSSDDNLNETGAVCPTQMVTPVKTSDHPMKRPPEWDHSYSDDDLLEHGGNRAVSVSCFHDNLGSSAMANSSMGVPLDFSTSSSSDDSFKQHLSLPKNKAATTPSYRLRRPANRVISTGFESPIFTSKDSFRSSSPVHVIPGAAAMELDDVPSSRLRRVSPPMFCLVGSQPRSSKRTQGGESRWEESQARVEETRRSESRGRGCDAEGQTAGEVRFNPVEPKNLLKMFETAE